MFPDPVAFVDVETTGMSPDSARVTEVGVVRVDGGRLTEWSSLVNPGCSIPAAIQALTGITNAMVAGAPRFSDIAGEVASRIAGCVFVAHNARFDYGFLKHEFARLGQPFTARVLCTVKLSRRLFADAKRHSLDSVIERHRLPADGRHRALGDARILWAFVQALYLDRPEAEIDAAIARILRAPSLPPNLLPGALDALPEAPGIYRFYGLNALPLYIGKSINLRERVASHFSSDYRSANDLRLSSEIVRIEFEETAGELGALLREAQLVKSLFPAHNQRLRRRTDLIALEVPATPAPPAYLRAEVIEAGDLNGLRGLHGPFSSRRAARETLRALAAKAALCWRLLGLERREGPCFARQLGKCAGACVGAETREAHHQRLREALAPYAFKAWPYEGMVSIREASMSGDRTDVHLFRDWCWLGTVADESSVHASLHAAPRAPFDLDVYRILCKRLPQLQVQVIPQRAPQPSWPPPPGNALSCSGSTFTRLACQLLPR